MELDPFKTLYEYLNTYNKDKPGEKTINQNWDSKSNWWHIVSLSKNVNEILISWKVIHFIKIKKKTPYVK